MKTLLKSNTFKFATLAAVLAVAPMVHAADSSINQAYEDLSGTHATPVMAQRSGEMQKKSSARFVAADINAAYEDLSGTHGAKNSQTGVAGKTGLTGEAGNAGAGRNFAPASVLFNIPGDVDGGCSQYLRCSAS